MDNNRIFLDQFNSLAKWSKIEWSIRFVHWPIHLQSFIESAKFQPSCLRSQCHDFVLYCFCQIFRYAVPARTVTKKHWLWRCTFLAICVAVGEAKSHFVAEKCANLRPREWSDVLAFSECRSSSGDWGSTPWPCHAAAAQLSLVASSTVSYLHTVLLSSLGSLFSRHQFLQQTCYIASTSALSAS